MSRENISELEYSLMSEDMKNVYTYKQLAELVDRPDKRKEIINQQCDTPVAYHFRKRFGFITVEKFLVAGQLAHFTMIVNKALDMSYLIHPDLKDKALSIERSKLEEQDIDSKNITKKEVLIPKLQVEINSEEYYVW